MKGLLSLLKSRKVWITVIGLVATIVGIDAGLSQEQVYMIAGLCAVLVLSIMGEDVAKYLKVDLPKDRQEADKKDLILTVIDAYTKAAKDDTKKKE